MAPSAWGHGEWSYRPPAAGATGTWRLRGPVRRSPDTRVLAGVCGGLSQATGIDVTLIRIGFVLLSLGSGMGILVYALAWLLLPLQGETTTIFSRAVNDRRGIRLVIAIIPVLVVIQIVADAWHIGYLGSFSWPVFLAAGIAILIRRNASEDERVWINDDLVPMLHSGGGPAPAVGPGGPHRRRRRARRRSGSSSWSRATPARRPCGRSAVPCWSSRPSWWSSGPGG